MLSKKLQDIKIAAETEIQTASSLEDLYQVKVKYLGKQGQLTLIMKDMASLSKEEKPLFGKEVNIVKEAVTLAHDERYAVLEVAELNKKLSQEELDLTLPGPTIPKGSAHLIPLVINEIVDILARVGFSVRTGPLVESDLYNFTSLNIPEDHPSRDMQDTFYIDKTHVLSTHTSPIQIRTML
ncbi:MAG: phenylalanine--tRNA ligase subunit alpha, partial [Bdellovibrionaceae bacterium]|nr:phenylalanine--tRNA ligase subunit alpha [Pseudobdellovibrionaceae bacterium]